MRRGAAPGSGVALELAYRGPRIVSLISSSLIRLVGLAVVALSLASCAVGTPGTGVGNAAEPDGLDVIFVRLS